MSPTERPAPAPAVPAPPSALERPVVITEAARPALLAPSAAVPSSAARRHPQVRVSNQLDVVLGGWLSTGDTEAAQTERRDLNAVVHRLLLVGLGLSTALMVVGLGLDLWLGQPLPTSVPPLSQTVAEALGGQPAGLLALGLLVLIATPIVRVLGSVAAFAYEHDRRYAVITLVVLLIVITSVILGQA